MIKETPPLTRGIVSRHALGQIVFGNTPADAGNSSPLSLFPSERRKHPR